MMNPQPLPPFNLENSYQPVEPMKVQPRMVQWSSMMRLCKRGLNHYLFVFMPP